MSDNAFQFVPESIIPKLSKLTPYTLLVLRKGENYHKVESQKIIQSEHLAHIFDQRETGIMVMTFPIMDNSDLAAIAIYNLHDKEEVKKYVERDPAVRAKIFSYEILNGVGLQGDQLP